MFQCPHVLTIMKVEVSLQPRSLGSHRRAHYRRIPGSQGSLGSMLGSLMYVSGTYRLYIGRASLPGSLLLCCPSSLRKNLKNSNDFRTNHIFLVNDKATHVLTMINKTYVTKLLATADCAMTSLTVLINRGG